MPITPTTGTTRRLSPGAPHPLGATLRDGGVNFALFSQHATSVRLLLFDAPDGDPTDTIPLTQRTKFIWHGFVHGLREGQLYGFVVDGPFEPSRGFRFNRHKLLLDPYAKAISHKPRNLDNLLLAYDPESPDPDRSLDIRENHRIMSKGVVVDDAFDWGEDRAPALPLEGTILYEVHVKGFTAHPSSGVSAPGTYLGFIERIPHLKELGVNAVELLPIHEIYVEDFLSARGLTNYWGYNTLSFFAPESSYAAPGSPLHAVREFKTLVRELHKAGIEVILDVVYNHTAEGNERGPTLSLKGIDNTNYYSLTGPASEEGRYYMNFTGCGNSLNLGARPALRLVMDSLRYWVEVMHVDGFRFDLASVLGREEGTYHKRSAFFDAVSQDPVLSRVKLIAEPWDCATYQVGEFPIDWSEWNGRFRDTVRRFIKGDSGRIADLAWRLTGSADLYGDDGRSPANSVNFLTCHDGFTLHDLTAYNQKHNEANGEHNRDGSDDNHSWNGGVEGETDDPEIRALRRRIAKNGITLLLFSCGTPMILGGDELLRTQRGNNNAYGQDNAISWFDWTLKEKNADFFDYTRRVIDFTRRYPVLQRRKFLAGKDINGNSVPDIQWFSPEGGVPDWMNPESRALSYLLDAGDAEESLDGTFLLVLLNAAHTVQPFVLPRLPGNRLFKRAIDTSRPAGEEIARPGEEVPLDPSDSYIVNPRSLVVLLAK